MIKLKDFSLNQTNLGLKGFRLAGRRGVALSLNQTNLGLKVGEPFSHLRSDDVA